MSARPCPYCGRRADSVEHILGTRIVDELTLDPRGLPLPITLHVAQRKGPITRSIPGRRTKRGRYTVELTTPVCVECNRGWMDEIDREARPFLLPMIRGEAASLDADARAAVATWATKVTVTAYTKLHPGPASKSWTTSLYSQHIAMAHWHIWIGRYDGREPVFFFPDDVVVRAVPGQRGPLPRDGIIADHGLLATLIIGYFAVQVFGLDQASGFLAEETSPTMTKIWPAFDGTVQWPPGKTITDDTLWATVDRLSAPAGPPAPIR